jgi:hypothetical protein
MQIVPAAGIATEDPAMFGGRQLAAKSNNSN